MPLYICMCVDVYISVICICVCMLKHKCVCYYVCVHVCHATLPVKCFSLTGETLKSVTTSVTLKKGHKHTHTMVKRIQLIMSSLLYFQLVTTTTLRYTKNVKISQSLLLCNRPNITDQSKISLWKDNKIISTSHWQYIALDSDQSSCSNNIHNQHKNLNVCPHHKGIPFLLMQPPPCNSTAELFEWGNWTPSPYCILVSLPLWPKTRQLSCPKYEACFV